jgi:hypothetical protein
VGWFTPKCPVGAEEKGWIEESMLWLVGEFGAETPRGARVVLPTDEFFPEPFSGDEEGARVLVERVCGYMGVDPARVEVEFFDDGEGGLRRAIPSYESACEGAAGHYRKRRGKFVVSLEASQAGDPALLVATAAHELAHARLLGEARTHAGREDHEPLADLLTVFLGMGVFTGNAVLGFRQWTDAFTQGWRTERRGYLTERMFGYALALFAHLRGEQRPAWAKHLEGDTRAYFKSAHKYLEKTGDTRLRRV